MKRHFFLPRLPAALLTVVLLAGLFGCTVTVSVPFGEIGSDTVSTLPPRTAAPEQSPKPTPEPSAPEPTPKPVPESAIFPITFGSYGNTYSVTGYRVGTADDGTTTVTLFGDGYNVLPFRNNDFKIPFWGEFYTAGTYHEAKSCSIGNGSAIYTFSTSARPDEIVVTNSDTGDEIVRFSVADVPQRAG